MLPSNPLPNPHVQKPLPNLLHDDNNPSALSEARIKTTCSADIFYG